MDKRVYGILLVTVASVLWSTAGLFVRLLDLDLWTMVAWRSLFGAIALGLIARMQPSSGARPSRHVVSLAELVGAAIVAVSMFAYLAALKLTTVANVVVVYATIPFVAAGIAFVWRRERVGRGILPTSLLSFLGVLITIGFGASLADLGGILLAFLMTSTFCVLVVMTQGNPGLKIAKVNALGALACGIAVLPLMPWTVPSAADLSILALFAVTTTALASILFLEGGRHVTAGEAGLIALLDLVLAPFWVWLVFAERPALPTIAGGLLTLGSVAWYLWRSTRRRPLAAPTSTQPEPDAV